MLKAKPAILGAFIFDRRGRIFARYDAANGPRPEPPPFQLSGYFIANDRLVLYEPVVFNDELVGVVCMESDTTASSSMIGFSIAVIAIVLMVSLGVAMLLTARLQHWISEPILHLVETAGKVAREKNYSVRARRFYSDEIALLIDAFNEMLARIEEHEAILEQRVKERTHELADSLSLLHATLESTADGILVVNLERKITSYNQKFVEMWRIPRQCLPLQDDNSLLEDVVRQLKYPEAFADRVRELYGRPETESYDIIEFKDGRVFERFSLPQRLGGECIGRVWSFSDITERRHAEEQLRAAHGELLQISRQAGMAEVAANVLHNVGNVLNSVNVSGAMVMKHLQNPHLAGISKVVELLERKNPAPTPVEDAEHRDRRLGKYLKHLGTHLQSEQAAAIRELRSLLERIEHINEIVATQQRYSSVVALRELQSLPALVDDALRIHGHDLNRGGIRVVREFKSVPKIVVDKHKTLQILINLISNAKHALSGMENQRLLTVTIAMNGTDTVRISVKDNGVGIAPENLTRIFGHGFTTRRDGHGFGLHGGALAAREMGGILSVHSDGLGHGATFTLELPVSADEKCYDQP